MAKYGKKASQAGDARAEERNAEERAIRQKSEESETSDRDWPVTGEASRCQGSA